ncbi:MAG: PAS domain-containing protein [Alphaproteobacteria bacterium]|nr:PAS domain-containing protein [Alphaproteobacteria bacterium]
MLDRLCLDLEGLGPDLHEIYAYWRRPADAGRLPTRRDFDPVIEIPRQLHRLALIDVVRDPFDLRYRLVGTLLVEIGGKDLTGRSLFDETYSPDQAATLEDYRTTVETGVPIARTDLKAHNSKVARGNRMVLPLFEPATDSVNMLLIAVEIVESAPKSRR